MKKLTENWKVKKGHLRNKTFRDSIDYSFSNIPKNENNKQNQSKNLKLNCLNKTSFLNLEVTSVIASEENDSTSPRRSSRLKEKSNSVKHVDMKAAKFDKDEINFSFNDSFGFTMANEVSKYEKPRVSNTSNSTDSLVIEKLNGVVHNLQTSKKENVLQKVKNASSAFETNKNVKSKEIPPLDPSDETATHEVIVNSQRNVHEKLINAVTSKSKCIEDLSQEMEVEKAPGKDCKADSLLDSKNNSALNEEDCLDLAYWGLPSQVISAYRSRNINKMFQWQYECLSMKNVLNGRNLVYSAPTSAGKTLVAEILMLKKVLESKKKAMMILPFVSVVREKVNYLQEMFQDTGVVVGGYMGAYRPPGGFRATDISICTIEKANNLINRLMEEKRLDELGILVVDELHMLGDTSRGYLLELLLTKLLYNCKRNAIDLQIIGMSATLPNLNVLSFWLDAELYYTDFRPVPLHEMYKVGPAVYDSKTHKLLRDLAKDSITFANDSDHTISLTIETVASGTGVLVFCPSKNWCETLATSIAREIFNTGKPTQEGHKNPKLNYIGQQLREHINGSALSDILLQLKNSPAGIDSVLKLTVPFGVAFHHAGLTYDERDIIEGAFKQGILKVLVATSTLSSGVNLPARRVLIRSPLFCGAVIDTLSYKQMVGRAGRKGIDNQGESILICKETERKSALQLVGSDLQPVKSCLMKSGKDGLHSSLKRAIIEVIASGAAVTHEEVIQYASCTLLFASLVHEANQDNPTENVVEVSINKCLDYLLDNDFIFKIEKKSDDTTVISYKPSQLGSAILSSGFSPEDSLRILKELQLARRSFVLENDLHILYEVTPPYLSDQMGSINWMNFLSLWEQLPEDYHRVGELVGVRESFMGLGIQGKIKMGSAQTYHKLAVHQRFYAALALNELIQEVPLAVVAEKYNCNKGILQSLQQTTSTFSGMLTIFCNRLGWHNLELLFSHFQKRVHFGIQQELCDLIQLSTLNAQRARVLYNAGYETVSSLATADPSELELVLCNAGAFESEKQLDGEVAEEAMKRREVKRIRITGKQGVNEKEAAILIIDEARNFIKHELGIKTISWKSSEEKNLSRMKKGKEADIPNKAIDTSVATKSVINESPSKQEINPQNDKITEVVCQNENVSVVSDNKSADAKHLLTTEKSKTNSSSESATPLLAVEKSKTSSSCQSVKLLLSTQKFKNNSFRKSVKPEDLIITDQNSEAIFLNSGDSEKNTLPENKSELQNTESTQNAKHLDVRKHPVSETLNSELNQSCKKQSNTDVIIKISQADKEERDLNCKHELNSVNIPQNNISTTSNKNETYFFTEEVSNLFVELEKTINDQTNNESSFFADTKVCVPIGENDLSTSQLLLSQSAELEDVYHGQSFLNAGLQNVSFSGCADNHPQNILSNSIIEEMNNKFTSKKTRDTLDALFDSPISDNGSFLKEDIVVTNHETTNHKKSYLHLSNIDVIFDSSNFDNTVTHKDSKMRPNCSLNKCSLEKSIQSKNIKEAVKKSIKRKSTIFEHCENANDTVHASPLDAFTLNKKNIAQSTPNAACIAMLDNNLPKTDPKMHDSRKSDSSHKSETSQDLFGESLDGDLLNQAQLLDIVSDKLENSPENNVQCISSCSDDIFGSDKSFEKMLGNHCAENDTSKLSNVQPKNNQKKRSFTESNEDCETDENKLLSSKNSNESQSSVITKKLLLENSGDLFEEAADSEPIFKDPKKQLSFEFDDNSEIFKTWNPSPNKSKLSNHVTKEEVKNNKIESHKESNLNCKQNESLFEEAADSEPIFKDPKKQLSLEFDDNSEIFKTWNPSPNKSKLSNHVTKEEVKNNKIESHKESNLNCKQNESLFEEAADSEPIFKDPKKQLSLEFDDNSEIFKTWNPSPNKSKLSNHVTKEEVKNNKIESHKESNLNCKQNESFLANLSDFSSFSSDCLEDTPPEKLNSTKTILLQSSVYKRKFSVNQDIAKDENKEKIFKTQNVHLKKIELSFSPTDMVLEKSIPAEDKMKFDLVEVIDENFDNFLKLLQNASIFGLSVACEKVEHKTAVNIGPPKLREKKKPSAEMLYVNDEIFVAGLSFCFNGKVYYMKFPAVLNNGTSISHLSNVQSKLGSLQQLFQSFSCKVIIAYDIKSYYKVLWKGCNIVLSQNKDISYLDPSVAAWLLDPSDGQQSLQGLVSNYWSDASHLIEGFDRSHGSLGLQHWSSISGQHRAVTESYISFHLIKILANHLKDKKLFNSFVDIEMPSILTLAKMERMGLGFDLKLAMDNRKELQKKQEVLMKKAYQLAGRSFNIMSSKDLSRILYKELRLSAPDSNTSPMASRHLGLGMATRGSAKKLPPELKTNKECLEKIMHLHPLPKTIMDWRKLSFALSKVLMPLLRENKFDKDFNMHRIYSTCYVYTVTGRINMHTPNLQFVPRDFNVHGADSDENGNSECYQIDDEISLYGVSLRNMFVPAEGNVLLSADYSQLELRILAHLSGDAKLLKSLNSGDDIFRQIAATWKNIRVSSVTDEIRQQAKKICYGIIYGMSAKSLAHQLKTSENEAADFMETFKKSYPGVTHYLNSVVESCRNKGYVTTIMERRRYLSHILSENKAERAHAERQAINTTIQGSAADIIKKATIEIDSKLKKLFSKEWKFTTSKKGTESSQNCCRGGFLVLQLHDELMYEVFKSDLDAVKNIVKTVMERTTKLSVILPVNIKVGTSWGSMKEIL